MRDKDAYLMMEGWLDKFRPKPKTFTPDPALEEQARNFINQYIENTFNDLLNGINFVNQNANNPAGIQNTVNNFSEHRAWQLSDAIVQIRATDTGGMAAEYNSIKGQWPGWPFSTGLDMLAAALSVNPKWAEYIGGPDSERWRREIINV